ncbi:MAG TPA: condensation domain-containing protein, partial [Thermoanaerobaculia bacterium]
IGEAASAETQAELEYWLGQRSPGLPRLPRDLEVPAEANTLTSQRSASLWLDTEETRILLQEVPQVYKTQINDVLLTALALAFQAWTGSPLLLVDLEGHGREDLFPEIDLTRTVGWFTTVYPVLLDLRRIQGSGEALKAVKEQLRSVPRGGVGYGLLGYGAAADRFAGLPVPEVSFNYLGQLDQVFSESLPFRAAREYPGPVRSPRAHRSYLLDVQGSVFTGRLSLSCSYSKSVHRPATIEGLVALLGQKLRDLIAHCRETEAGGFTTSDFPLAGLTQAQLDSILRGGKL